MNQPATSNPSACQQDAASGSQQPAADQAAPAADRPLIGAIEAGGTKMVLACGYADGTITERTSIPTQDPAQTVPAMIEWFANKGIAALGIAAFGPTGVNPSLSTYGHILQTPKLAWRNFDFLGAMSRGLNVPCGYDTDVNGACLGEVMYGAAKGLDSAMYITVGTGIGAGIYAGGQLIHGMLHPEAGHITLPRAAGDQDFECVCPTHDSCFEGLAAGPAVVKRYGVERASDMADDEGFLELEGTYIAQGILNYLYVASPQRIILGGGVPDHAPKLMDRVRAKVLQLNNGYISTPELDDIDSYIVPPACDGNQGVLGAIALGAQALQQA
ncbi:ROK family protein [Collinsella tanakaei]|uniref:ROK family protein n=1 Tax=Collinsella tanakaei TaxID=626935 RepID=UPI00248D5D10|nr:ROK family protein [Collinsella tanakaei]